MTGHFIVGDKMERWVGKVAVVTGASVGIGHEVLKTLADKGMIAVGLARRDDNIKKLAQSSNGVIHAIKCDVTKESDIVGAFKWIEDNLGGVDLLVNNAGIMPLVSLVDGSSEPMRSTYEVNVIALCLCTREALKTMRLKENGQIININSTAGHQIIPLPKCGVYSSSKHAVTSISKSLRLELKLLNSKIKVTSLCPGLVHTDMSITTTKALENHDVGPVGGKRPEAYLNCSDLADCVVNIISMQPHVQMEEMILQGL